MALNIACRYIAHAQSLSNTPEATIVSKFLINIVKSFHWYISRKYNPFLFLFHNENMCSYLSTTVRSLKDKPTAY